jgi:ABC-2 type transport system permease protein
MFKIARKDLRIFFSDPKAVMLTFLLPVSLITLFVFAFGGNKQRKGMSEMKLLVSDLDQSAKSKMLVAQIDSLDALQVISSEWEEAKVDVREGDHYTALCIYKNYLDSIQAGKPGFEFIYDEAKPTESGIVQGVLYNTLFSHAGKEQVTNQVMSSVNNDFGVQDSVLSGQIKESVEGMMSQNNSENNPASSMVKTIAVKPPEEINPALVHSVAGTAIMMLLFSVAAMGAGLLDEKEKGTLRKLLQSPISPMSILYGKLLNAIVIGSMQLWGMLLFASVVFGLPLLNYFIPLFILVPVIALTCGCFGIFIASICTSRKQVEGLSTLVVLVMSAIGGSMIPVFIMPAWMQSVSAISVNHWAIKGFYTIYLYDFTWSGFAIVLGVLLGFTVLLLSLSRIFFRRNVLRVV